MDAGSRLSGALQSLGDTAIAGGPAPLAVDPQQRFLFAGLRDAQSVASFAIDPASGALAHIDTVPVGLNPVYVAVDATGNHLLLATYGGDLVAVHGIDADGRLQQSALDSEATDTNPHAIVLDPSNAFAFVPNTNADKILQYTFDAQTGQLAPNTPAEITTPMNVGPRHLVFDPAGDHLYVVNEHADSVTTYAFDAASGTLDELDTDTTLPSGADAAANTCADIHVTPDGRFVYASNRGHDSIAIFAVDAQSHALTAVGHQSTEPIPREFEIAGDGRFLYAAGQSSGMLAAYRIDDADGTLLPLDTYTVGAQPLWVLEVAVPRP